MHPQLNIGLKPGKKGIVRILHLQGTTGFSSNSKHGLGQIHFPKVWKSNNLPKAYSLQEEETKV